MKSLKDIETWIKEQRKIAMTELDNIVIKKSKTYLDFDSGHEANGKLSLLTKLDKYILEG